MGNVRMWIGSAGSEPLGSDSDGTPVLGSGDGVEVMREIGGILDWTFTPTVPQDVAWKVVPIDGDEPPGETYYKVCPDCGSTDIAAYQDGYLWVESCAGCGITLSDSYIGDLDDE